MVARIRSHETANGPDSEGASFDSVLINYSLSYVLALRGGLAFLRMPGARLHHQIQHRADLIHLDQIHHACTADAGSPR